MSSCKAYSKAISFFVKRKFSVLFFIICQSIFDGIYFFYFLLWKISSNNIESSSKSKDESEYNDEYLFFCHSFFYLSLRGTKQSHLVYRFQLFRTFFRVIASFLAMTHRRLIKFNSFQNILLLLLLKFRWCRN